MIDKDTRQGIFFGINSGILATVGMIAGIAQTTSNPMYIIVSVVTLSISDTLGEGYSMYLSKKAEDVKKNGYGPIISMVSILLSKTIIMLLFLLPLLFFWDLKYYKNLIWPLVYSLLVLLIIDLKLAELREESPKKYFISHVVLLTIILVSTKLLGKLFASYK